MRVPMLADRRLCLDRSLSRLVEEMSEDAAIMVVAKGDEVPADLVTRLDLQVWSNGRVMQGPEPGMPEVAAVSEAAPVAPLDVAPEPESVPLVAPLEGIVHPAGAMPEPSHGEVKAYLGIKGKRKKPEA